MRFLIEFTIVTFLLCFIGPKLEVKIKQYHLAIKVSDWFENRLNSEDTTLASLSEEQKGKIIVTAKEFLDVPYVYGGTSRENGIDCSAFVQTVFYKNGIKLPRTAAAQFTKGKRVRENQLEPGDLVFFKTCVAITHVGIICDNNRHFIHASSDSGKVAISRLDGRYEKKFIGGRRIG